VAPPTGLEPVTLRLLVWITVLSFVLFKSTKFVEFSNLPFSGVSGDTFRGGGGVNRECG
jgi:hypothetical protein